MMHFLGTVPAFKSFQNQAEVLVRNYVLADPYIPYTSVLGGILMCKLVYDLTELISNFYFRSYNGLTKIQKIEWNNRGMSTLHAIFISVMSVYFVFWSELFSDQNSAGPITLRNSPISTFALGMSVGYFISNLGMICWLYPSLGETEYIVHYSLSGITIAYSMFMGEGQLYTFMALISELTTPEIKLRWYLDMAGLKRSSAYLINGFVVARIILFVYMFYHVYLHHAQVMQMHNVGFLLVFAVPLVLAVMNTRGNMVLHVAATCKEPSIIVQLLSKGAGTSESTFEGQCAVTICRGLTRPKDYQMKREKGQEANKDRICIEVLEREMCRNPIAGDASISSLAMADDLHMKLLYLEDRVAFTRMIFPTEAKLAMEIAQGETTSELAGLLSSRGSSGNLVEVDLNETPITQNKRLLSRIETLLRTVELGRRYFPHCSQVLDKFLEDDLPDAFYLEKGTPEEQRMKRMRFMELKDEVQKAFNKDKAELHHSGISSSSSSSSFKDSISYKVRKV